MPKQKKTPCFGFSLRLLLALAGILVILILASSQFLLRSCESDARSAQHTGSDDLVRNLQQEVADLKKKNALLEFRLERAASDPGRPSNQFLTPQDQVQKTPAAPTASNSGMAGFTDESTSILKGLAEKDAVGVMLVVCKRPQLFKDAMASVLKADRDTNKFPIIISQDDYDQAMTDLVQEEYVRKGLAFHLHHPHQQDAVATSKRFGGSKTALGYVYIAQHYGYIMRTMFDAIGFHQLIFLEEDLQVAPDFFSYFQSMLPILRTDKDLFCVSAWNDNGAAKLVKSPDEVFRTDFFPGLGWMMDKHMWNEVRDRWADAYWDEFMRRPDVRKGRRCIRPEISRTYTIGFKKGQGASSGQWKDHLESIMLNTVAVDWARKDLSFLASTASFENSLEQRLRAAKQINQADNILAMAPSIETELRIRYVDKRDVFEMISNMAACEQNSEGITRAKGTGGHNLETCKNLCSQTPGCVAIDFYSRTKWCNLFNVACMSPEKIADGSSSYKLKVEPDSDPKYSVLAHQFFLMPDEKEGIRRMSYRGVIPFVWLERHVFLYTKDWPEGLS